MSDSQAASRQKWQDPLLFLVVCTTGICAAAFLLDLFLSHPRLLWNDVIHDRNAHLLSGMKLAAHTQQGAVGQIFADLDSSRTWPPLHDSFAVGLSLMLGHNQERWAILPSLMAWVGSAIFAYLLVRKAAARGGRIGGLIAVLLILVSPAQRAYATDVMLESLGACLTLACLYTYVAARQNDTPRAYRHLAIALTLLFLEKYNYWTLVVLGLIVDQISSTPTRLRVIPYLQQCRKRLRDGCGRAWLTRQGLNPWNYLLAALIVLIAVIILAPWNQTTLLGHRILLQPPANLITLAYICLCLRLVPWYRNTGRLCLAQASPGIQALFTWHIWPIAVWFLWPQRLYSFLWVNSPAANGGEFPHHDLLGGYAFYAGCLVRDYHVGVWSLAAAVGLFLVGIRFAGRGRLPAGATAIFWLVAIACVLTIHHPNRKSRFLHTWIPVLWAGTGIGAGCLMPWGESKRKGLAWACCGGGMGVLLIAHLPRLATEAHAPEGGIPAAASSSLDITDAYLPDLTESRDVAVFSDMPVKQFTQWTYMQRYPLRKRLETDVKGFDPQAKDNHACFDAWLRTTQCDTVVYLDFATGTRFYRAVPGCENFGQYGQMLQKQQRFSVVARHILTPYGCTVTVWKRNPVFQSPSR